MDEKKTVNFLLSEADNLLLMARDLLLEKMDDKKLKELKSFISKLQECRSIALVPFPKEIYNSTNSPGLVRGELTDKEKWVESIEEAREKLKEVKESI